MHNYQSLTSYRAKLKQSYDDMLNAVLKFQQMLPATFANGLLFDIDEEANLEFKSLSNKYGYSEFIHFIERHTEHQVDMNSSDFLHRRFLQELERISEPCKFYIIGLSGQRNIEYQFEDNDTVLRIVLGLDSQTHHINFIKLEAFKNDFVLQHLYSHQLDTRHLNFPLVTCFSDFKVQMLELTLDTHRDVDVFSSHDQYNPSVNCVESVMLEEILKDVLVHSDELERFGTIFGQHWFAGLDEDTVKRATRALFSELNLDRFSGMEVVERLARFYDYTSIYVGDGLPEMLIKECLHRIVFDCPHNLIVEVYAAADHLDLFSDWLPEKIRDIYSSEIEEVRSCLDLSSSIDEHVDEVLTVLTTQGLPAAEPDKDLISNSL
ncbi:hypothetical protein GCM10011607_12390 [Shewanella inventionis]|uniref:Uncharacterized protein n=1 Tax=Shewanella inventionis TaxID=1738770 RepID=A0ABQ1IYC9_9GAMM|nr:hypothetical protein [Shewanella inventionis]GGB53353.1 hypothetical protein GCM10011607_12390 [Shewanella inventionis]